MKPLDRRSFLFNLGRGTMAVAVFGLAACGDDASTTTAAAGTTAATSPPTTAGPVTTEGATTTAPPPETTAPPETTEPPTTTTAAAPGGSIAWERVDLGFVSAYVLVRDGAAAVVDTGVPGSADAIEEGLGRVGLGWADVPHVILTHFHGDHVGSVADVLGRAAGATAYAGEADIGEIASPQPLTPIGDGDEVFGLQVVHTPGHTPGHVAVFDPAARLLVAGDALNGGEAMGGDAGTVAGPNPQFSPDMASANESVKKLAALLPDTILFGHGGPVEGAAAEMLTALAAEL